MIKRLLFVFLGLSASLLPAQNILKEIAETQIGSSGERWIVPQRYRTFQLDRSSLQSLLTQVQGRTAVANRENALPIVHLPLPDGSAARFYLAESTVMAPALQARYPEIRAFTGQGADDPSTLLKCEWTPTGFHAMLFLTGKGTVFIDPYRNGDTDHYIVYFKKDYLPKAKNQPFSCGTAPADIDRDDQPGFPSQVAERSNDGQLRRYRLALACTGEYALFHGGTKPLVLAAMVTSMNRVNGVYEREFAVTMELIAKNDTLINLDPDADPYDNGDGGTMLGQNRTACNARVGSANYDMGHVFSTGGGGIASIRSVCTDDKAMGVTGQDEPIGDAFDIDYVAHEMGHQFGGNHTQNNPCNRNGETAMEPGSGSTIMGYAGICAPDVQPHSDDYFHGVNLTEMLAFILNGDGNTCPVKTEIANNPPEVSAGPDFIIPKSTPFVLTAQGSDPDGEENKITYCWEQMDPDEAPMPPESGSNLGPLFRSNNPDTLPLRYFPRLQNLVLNQTDDWEKLPSVGRKMNFRVTIRDNHPAGGHTAQDDMLVTVNNNTGPFRVSSPGIGANWLAGSWQIVTWDVANSDKAPVNCKTVNIRLSTDGGYTYPLVLAANVPNNGKYCIRVPDVTTSDARLMVEAVGNIFFDINNFNFNIGPAPAPAFSLCVSELSGQVCLPATYTVTVSTSALSGYDTPLALSVQGLPPAASAVFTPNPVTPGADAVLSLNFPDGSLEETLDLTILGTADSTDIAVNTTLILVSNDFDELVLQTPVNGASGQNETPVLHWKDVPDADFYDVELATSPSFDLSTIVASRQNTAIDSFKVPVLLEKGQVYYWRVRPKNECGTGMWVGPFAFSTLINVCAVKNANGLPINITGNQPVTVESKIVFTGSSIISDINVTKIQGSHQFFKEIEVSLISPKGTELQMFKGKCGGFSGNFNFGFDDASPTAGPTCPPSNTGAIFRPEFALSKFNGEDAAGDWILRVKDDAAGSGGMLSGFGLELCANTTLNPPVLVNNNILFIEPGKNKAVTTDLLKTTDTDNTDDQLVYTLMTVPQYGQLQVNGNGALLPGVQFYQTDLNNGAVRYFHYGGSSSDAFCFTVTDGQGGIVQDCFTIQPFPVGADEPERSIEFTLAPNPVSESLRITFSGPLRSNTRIRLLDASGRLLRFAEWSSGQYVGVLGVTDLPSGIYFLAVDNADGYGIQKVSVRR